MFKSYFVKHFSYTASDSLSTSFFKDTFISKNAGGYTILYAIYILHPLPYDILWAPYYIDLRRGAAKKSPSGAPCGEQLFTLARRGAVRYHKNVRK
jgi:hypothetical protein